jgi:hypothetical protein
MVEKARLIFQEIKRRIIKEIFKPNLLELEKAVEKLIGEYDTANWENRFVCGSALEILFCAFLKSLGFECKWLKEARYDLAIEGINFSLKSNFTGKGDIRLINILGDEKVVFKEPTLFFISEIGICYADPQMGIATKHTNDALVVETKEIKKMVENNEEWVIPIHIPTKPKDSKKIKTASYDVAKSILEEINSQHLKKYLISL